MYVYNVSPIDWWGGWMTVEHATTPGIHPHGRLDRGEVEAFLEAAKTIAQSIGWEGDMRQGPFVSGLPDVSVARPLFMVAWKQDNNGTTFIASPVPLVHIERAGYEAALG